jgi:hypothetical protein
MNSMTRIARLLIIIAPSFMLGCSAAPDGAVTEEATGSDQEAVYTGCWGTGPEVTDTLGNRWSTMYCHAYAGGDVYAYGAYDDDPSEPGNSNPVVGYLNAGNSWFVCQVDGWQNPHVAGGAVNRWWLMTQADRATAAGRDVKGWGWFPANRISGGRPGQRIPGLPDCE